MVVLTMTQPGAIMIREAIARTTWNGDANDNDEVDYDDDELADDGDDEQSSRRILA